MKNNEIVVLVILIAIFGYLLMNCKGNGGKEGFMQTTNNEPPRANGFRIIDIKEDSIKVEFYAPESTNRSDPNTPLVDNNNYTKNLIDGYVIIVAKYNSNSQNSSPIGDNYRTVFVKNDSNNITNTNIPKYNSDYYTKTIYFGADDNNSGDDYYYRIGLIVSYNNGNAQSRVLNVDNAKIRNSGGFFKLGNKNVQQVDIDFEEYLKFKEDLPKEVVIDDDNCANSADGKLELIKRNLGGYPDNLFIEERTGPKSLKELAKRQLSLGILDINVHTKDL